MSPWARHLELCPEAGAASVVSAAGDLVSLLFLANALWQLLPRPGSEPPLVFHWIPFVGNVLSYGTDPCGFYTACRQKVHVPIISKPRAVGVRTQTPTPPWPGGFASPLPLVCR